jgi:hypothetical protein
VRLVLALAVAALVSLPRPATHAQERDPLLAFRFDSQRIVATLRSDLNVSLPQLGRGAPRQMAKFGYPIFEFPDSLQTRVPSSIRIGEPWSIHTAAGQVFEAVVERFVLGEAQCSKMLAAVMKVDDAQAWAFARVRSKYYVADSLSAPRTTEPSPLGELPATAITPEIRRAIDATLARLVTQELPMVRAEANKWLARMSESEAAGDRSWARGVLRSHEALAEGAATVTYDAQPYRLTPDGAPRIFVRAIWRVGEQQAFAAAAWIRADTGEVVWKNLRPASWVTMERFRAGVSQSQLGLVLNVVDRDGDGWAEIVFAQEGYEGASIELLETGTDFSRTGIEYGYGC